MRIWKRIAIAGFIVLAAGCVPTPDPPPSPPPTTEPMVYCLSLDCPPIP